MSRGLGRVERRILDILKGSPLLSAAKIAWWVEGSGAKPSTATQASVRRALLRLKVKGLVLRATDGRAWVLTATAAREAKAREKAEHKKAAGEEAQRRARERDERAGRDDRSRWERVRDRAEKLNRDLNGGRARGAADVTRLIALLGMLGSAHDGEALNAARLVEAERRKLGKQWADLIRAVPW